MYARNKGVEAGSSRQIEVESVRTREKNVGKTGRVQMLLVGEHGRVATDMAVIHDVWPGG